MPFGEKKQAMAVCYRLKGDEIQFLLVRNKKGTRRTFPKGTIKKGEMPRLTAVREAQEEAGVLGETTNDPLTVFPITRRGEVVMVEAFLVRVETEGLEREKKRRPRWYNPQEAQQKLSLLREPDDAAELTRVIRIACKAIKYAPRTGHLAKPLVPDIQPIRIFVSYSHQDGRQKNSLLGFISASLEPEGVEFWHDRRIVAGEMWGDVIRNEIERSDIALLFVSQAFLNSEFCRNVEVPMFLKKRSKAGLTIFPIILSPCDWQSHAWLADTQAIPGDGQSISRNYVDRGRRDELFLQILRELREVSKKIRAGRSARHTKTARS